MGRLFRRIDPIIAGWMQRYGLLFLRVSVAVVFIWFGLLKPFGQSPAHELVAQTVGWAVDPELFIPILGWWEVAIGVCLLVRSLICVAIALLALQMIGALLPLFFMPDTTWIVAPFRPTLEGQYIIKNLVLISAAIVIGGTVRAKASAAQRL